MVERASPLMACAISSSGPCAASKCPPTSSNSRLQQLSGPPINSSVLPLLSTAVTCSQQQGHGPPFSSMACMQPSYLDSRCAKHACDPTCQHHYAACTLPVK